MGHALGNNYGKQYGFLSKPVWVDCNFQVQNADTGGLGITSLKGQGIQNVFMHTSATPGRGPNGYLNPNPAAGYALIQLAYNYTRYCGGLVDSVVSPVTGSNLAINATALTAGIPYSITAVGHSALGTATIAPVADTAGSLASTWFKLFDNYGNTFVIWFSVAGVGVAPTGTGGILVQQSIASGATAAQIGAALVTTIAALPSGISGVFSFTASGTTTVTVTSTQTNPYSPLPGAPSDGVVPTGFTFAKGAMVTNNACWQGVGLPKGVVPAVGVGFLATATGFATGSGSTGTVKAAGLSGVSSVEIVGDPNLSFAPVPMGGSPNTGGWILAQILAPTSSSVTTVVPTAPANGSTIYLGMLVEQASILVAGE